MAKIKKTGKVVDKTPAEKTREESLPVDENGEPQLPTEDTEATLPLEDEMEMTPPYEPPPPAEGP